jgi:hypothetical protein
MSVGVAPAQALDALMKCNHSCRPCVRYHKPMDIVRGKRLERSDH